VAALAPHVLNAAREGEVVAQRTVEEAARELVELVVMLGRHFPGTAAVPVAVTGGLLLPQSPLTAAFRERLATSFTRARLVPERIDAALGALKLAAELE
jgi:N-acetylglucosamine kinase-like BadF-type ATPase